MSNNSLNYDQIRARAEKRVKKRAEFFQHLAVYLVVNVFLWIMFGGLAFVTHTPLAMIPAFLSTMGWGIAITLHAITVFIDTKVAEDMREREIDREMRREMQRLGIEDPEELYEKPKRDQNVRLSDDGELVYEDEEPRKQSRRGK